MRNPGGLNKCSGNEDEEKMMVLKYILKVGMRGPSYGWWKVEREKGTRLIPRSLAGLTGLMGKPFNKIGKFGRKKMNRKIKRYILNLITHGIFINIQIDISKRFLDIGIWNSDRML